MLREYHAAMGRLDRRSYEGTLERFAGDGIMVFFNDPVPVPDAGERAVRMALRDAGARSRRCARGWTKLGYDLDLGIGIAQGYATLGAIGFEGRFDYAAIGAVTNLAARLCGEAKPGQILTNRRTLSRVESLCEGEPLGSMALKGFAQPVEVFNIIGLKTG